MYDEYISTLEKQKEKENEIEKMKTEITIIKEGQQELLHLFKNPKKLLTILDKE